MLRLHAPLVFRSQGYLRTHVPAGFTFDGASIPPFLRWVINPLDGEIGAAAAVHDWLYVVHSVPRKQADQLFYEALISLGASRWKAWIMWAGVRVRGQCGWESYYKRREEAMALWHAQN